MYDDEYIADWDLPPRAHRKRPTFNEYTAAFDAGYRSDDTDAASKMHADDFSRVAEDAREGIGTDELGRDVTGLE